MIAFGKLWKRLMLGAKKCRVQNAKYRINVGDIHECPAGDS